jgi:AcrR family transcriptional regulator
MPRITAPTLAEHRSLQRAALLDAAESLVVESGPAAATFAAVAHRAGLARSSVYEYFSSPSALVADLVADRLRRWGQETGRKLHGVDDPAERIGEYVRLSLSGTGQRHGGLAQVISATDLPAECRVALVALHDEVAAPLMTALAELGITDVPRASAHIAGVVDAARRRIANGAAARAEIDAARAFVLGAVTSDRGDAPQPT